MKNKVVMFTLVSVAFCMSAFSALEAIQVPSSSTVPGFIRAPEAMWADLPISSKVQETFKAYVKDKLAGSAQSGDSEFDLNSLANALIEQFDQSNLNFNERFNGIILAFCFKIASEGNGEIVQEMGKYFLGGTLGEFIAKMYKDLDKNSDAVIQLNVRTRVALRNDGYHKEYFLGETIDNEKRDGQIYYIHSESVQRPTGFLSMLGFGYTDKRNWGRYLLNKAAVIGGAAAAGGLAYFAGKRYHDQQQRRYNALNQPQGGFRSFIEGNRKAWQDLEKNQPSAIEQFTNIPRAVGGYFFNKPINMAKTVNQRIETKEDMRHNTHKQIVQLKKEEKERLREANKATRSKKMQSQQGVYNPVGSAFDIEGGMPLGTTEYRENLRKQIKQEYADKIKEVKEQLSQDLRNVK